jgi:uncharacterized protein (DUF488 family)
MNNRKIYTIGYTAFSSEAFIEQLVMRNITCLVDVRSNPNSAYYTEYNHDVLSTSLKRNGIYYRNYAREFGARQTNPKYFTAGGYLDFDKFGESIEFRDGVEKINKGMSKGYIFALMCAEKDPINCHRSIMVAKTLISMDFEVKHILSGGSEETQQDIEEQLVNKWFKNKDQISIFEPIKSYHELLIEAYRLQNEEIGFRKED